VTKFDRSAVLGLACVAVFVASSAQADPARRIEPQLVGDLAAAREACFRLPAEPPSRHTPQTPSTALPTVEVSACLMALRAEIVTPDPVRLAAIHLFDPALSTDEARRRQRLEIYRGIRRVAAWVTFIEAQTGPSSLGRQVAGLDADARALMNADGLLAAKYAARLQGAFVSAGPGGYAGQPRDTPGDGTRSAVVRVDVDTAHLDVGAGWDASLGFQCGREPLLRMTKPAGAAAAIPTYRDGLITSQTVRIGRASGSAETSITGRAGATRLDVAGAASNDVAEWALFFDARADLKWYGRDMWLVHVARQTLDPLVDAYVGVRHDQRFHRAGDLSEFDDPTGRLFFGFAVHPIRVADPHARGSGNTLLSIGGAFEYEGALRGPARLPSGFKLLVGGNLDLPRALQRR
jgi:hypothetical protein